MDAQIKKLMQETRARLIMERHFFGFPSMQLQLRENPRCSTMQTNGVILAYNPRYVERIEDDERQTMIAHETSHCMLGHVFRRMGRDMELWNRACDYVVNDLLARNGFRLWPGALVDGRFQVMSAEQVYEILLAERNQEQDNQQGQDDSEQGDEDQDGQGDDEQGDDGQDDQDGQDEDSQDDQDGDEQDEDCQEDQDGDPDEESQSDEQHDGQGDPQPDDLLDCPGTVDMPGQEDEAPVALTTQEVADQWSVAIVQAAHMAELAGQAPAGMERIVEQTQESYVDWKSVLREFVSNAVPYDTRWFPPNRRHLWRGMYLPSVAKRPRPNLLIVVDSSGSTTRVIPQFVAEVNAVMNEMHCLIHVVTCDTEVYEVGTFDDEPIGDLKISGGGGTSFIPPFEWARVHTPEIDAMIYLTDGYGTFPPQPAAFPTLWVMSTHVKPPWGEMVRIP